MRVDAHHHLWQYDAAEFGWIDDRMASLRRDFLLPELEREMAAANVHAAIAVQARQTLEETRFLLDIAEHSSHVLGVPGWAPIADPEFPATLEALAARPQLKGLRHMVQAEPEGFLEAPAFNRGIRSMRDSGLLYQLLVYARQLPEAVRFVDRHPGQVFVLDHIGKPAIAAEGLSSRRRELRDLASRPHVFCKLSGMVTEASWSEWTAETLWPYAETVLEAFGADRVMVGTDWPVLTLACSYRRWWETVSGWLARLSSSERDNIEGGVANKLYRLNLPETPQ